MSQDGMLSGVQAVIALTVMTVFVPCVANLLMNIKERLGRQQDVADVESLKKAEAERGKE